MQTVRVLYCDCCPVAVAQPMLSVVKSELQSRVNEADRMCCQNKGRNQSPVMFNQNPAGRWLLWAFNIAEMSVFRSLAGGFPPKQLL